MKKDIELQNVVWREGKYCVAQCLNVDVSSFGQTQNEALKNLIEAVELYLEDDSKFNRVDNPKLIKRNLAHA
ncbi:MAG TPA: type II toxin-antitoxin system HicB family antitoxin [Patescibacteria group bacterium]|nr:type II toxin-antitoxin system HicB family antitoxin [Patescibacteria group bacterium]